MRRREARSGLPSRPGTALGSAAALVALALLPVGAAAQSSSDFLFGSPSVTLGVYGGYAIPGADGGAFDFTTQELTVERSDFASVTLGGRLAVRLHERVDLALDVAHAGANARSEYREWVDQDDRPIEQTTSFSRTPVTLGVKVYPWDRGRSIGRFVWIPRGVSPYVGAGAGIVWYEYNQVGDFVDYETLDIFAGDFDSDGQAAAGRAFAGLDVSLGPRFLVNGEVRYLWAGTDMDTDEFVEDDGVSPLHIGLSGLSTTVGVAVRL